MTYKEAHKIIGKFTPDTKIDNIDKLDAMMVALKALEKQIAEAVKRNGTEVKCGACGKLIGYFPQKYVPNCQEWCYHCGQALIWNEEDDS